MENCDRPRVLVVDDNPDVRAFIRAVLERAGFEVEEARDGLRALGIACAHPVDVLITDVFMPELDGLELIEAVRARFPHTRILAMSGGGQIARGDYLPVCDVIGADAVLRKPFREETLIETLRALLAIA